MLLVTVSGRTVRAQVTEQDSLALVALYNATNGPNWTDNTNWLTTPVSQWFGVTVTGDRVTSLSLTRNQLTGSIPPELGNLSNLTQLRLDVNELTGSIPPELGTLTNLTALGLFTNELTGSIPEELGTLTNLTFLDLGTNELTGSIPVELGNLTGLTALYLDNTLLSGTLPLSLTNLSMLDIFWFDETSLCEPVDDAFQAWLLGISDLRSTGCTNVATEEAAEIPAAFALETNYPNPFNPSTTIRYALPQPAAVRLSVYDVQGRLVTVLVEAEQATGWHEVGFEAGALPSGVYFYRLEAGVFRDVRQMLLLR